MSFPVVVHLLHRLGPIFSLFSHVVGKALIGLLLTFFGTPKKCFRSNIGAPRSALEEGRHHRLLELEGILREEVGISHLSFPSGLKFPLISALIFHYNPLSQMEIELENVGAVQQDVSHT